ncbi:phosphatase PAP2 family protein [Corynebacterium pacaense]|uniref:phosphatase PAP2 family protein n=1 Tax=Corynebacterium pacaense TaxID=1816684 RepID=UPI001FECE973|nr:phosphatase PAP2 family protein [Corynebacterium pacaense]
MLDQQILDLFINHRLAWLTPLVIAFTTLTGPTFMWIYSIIVGCATRRIWPPVAVGAANIISHVLKKVVDKQRPGASQLVEETNASLPSGHAVGAAAFAMVLTLLVRRWWVSAVWLLALLVGLSRVYVGVHWPSDILAGWALGAGVAALTSWSFLRLRRSPS